MEPQNIKNELEIINIFKKLKTENKVIFIQIREEMLILKNKTRR